jgi:ABC-type thiamin/hydroxymethylpyrimidine transport system permease subunit
MFMPGVAALSSFATSLKDARLTGRHGLTTAGSGFAASVGGSIIYALRLYF